MENSVSQYQATVHASTESMSPSRKNHARLRFAPTLEHGPAIGSDFTGISNRGAADFSTDIPDDMRTDQVGEG